METQAEQVPTLKSSMDIERTKYESFEDGDDKNIPYFRYFSMCINI